MFEAEHTLHLSATKRNNEVRDAAIGTCSGTMGTLSGSAGRGTTIMQTEVTAFKKKNAELKIEVEVLMKANKKVQKQFDTARGSTRDLQRVLNSLRSDHAVLQENYAALQEDHAETHSRCRWCRTRGERNRFPLPISTAELY